MKLKKTELEAALREAEHRAGVLDLAVMFLARGTPPDAYETCEYGDARYALRLFGASRADGGIIVGVLGAGPKAHTFVSYLDAYVSQYAGHYDEASLPLRTALERLTRVRNRLLLGSKS